MIGILMDAALKDLSGLGPITSAQVLVSYLHHGGV